MSSKTADRIGVAALLLIFMIVAATIFINVPHHDNATAEQMLPGADPSKADAAIHGYGCGACHTIPGIMGANGTVGPMLDHLAQQSFLAGQLPNTPDNLILWIQHPQEVRPGVDMPDTGVSTADARNIAAYLYSLH